MTMLTVSTLMVVSTAHVERDITELELTVKVCKTYYRQALNLQGNVTSDIDECTSGTDDCHPDASCNNTVGSFDCTCLPGFEGDGTSCTGKYLNSLT